jgi:hypothetical protein
VQDRVRRSHEQWWHFTKEPRYFSAVDEVREEHRGVHGGGGGKQSVAALAVGMPAHRQLRTTAGHPLGALPGSVWTVPTEPLRVPEHLGVDHFAAFPSEFPRRIISGWSPRGVCVECGEGRRPVATVERIGGRIRGETDVNALGAGVKAHGINAVGAHSQYSTVATITGYACACPEPTAPTTPSVVLDPFSGTGTTAHVAYSLGRQGIGVDLSADYCRIARDPDVRGQRVAKVRGIKREKRVEVEGQADLFGEGVA